MHAPVKELHFNLSGNMNRYVWTINNKAVSETDKIMIKKGENVRIILYNGTMMRHPMHLHGHFFRLLNGQGDYSPLKNGSGYYADGNRYAGICGNRKRGLVFSLPYPLSHDERDGPAFQL
jgi:FtsP/CotA-like multicopper oxidase with cupredoxin domain